MAKLYGKTWWGQQWLQSLSNIDHQNRLARGSSYANKGAVAQINFNENKITAKVKGSYPRPYDIKIVLPTFTDVQLHEFIAKLARKPVILSKLLHRELDPEVLVIAQEMDLKVFPKQWSDFKMECSCPDWAVPCKHLAAVIYKVSAEIDNNPFLVFELHNLDLIAKFKQLGIVVNKDKVRIPDLVDLYFEEKKTKKTKKVDYLPENAYQKLNFSSLLPIHEPLIALLTNNPAFYQGNGDFKEKYSSEVKKIVKIAQKVILGKTSLESLFVVSSHNTSNITYHSRIDIQTDSHYDSSIYIDHNPVSFPQLLNQLAQVPLSRTKDYQASTAVLHSILHLCIHLIANGAIIPQIFEIVDSSMKVRWLPARLSKEVRDLLESLETMIPPRFFTGEEARREKVIKAVDKDIAVNLTSLFLSEIVGALASLSNPDAFLNLFFQKKDRYPFSEQEEAALSGGIMVWLQKYYITQGKYKPQIVVEEGLADDFEIQINIHDNEQDTMAAPYPLANVLTQKKYDKTRYEILQSITPLSSFIRGLDGYVNNACANALVMQNDVFSSFLMDVIPAIQLLDISILLPKSLREILKPKASIQIKTKAGGKSFLRLEALLDFDWQVAIGDTLMNEAEFKKLLKKSEGLIKFKSNYIYVNEQELQKIHKYFSETKQLSAFQMLRAALSGEYQGAKIGLTDEVNALIKELTTVHEIDLPKGLNAQLRPYQHRGYSWMYRNSRIGFGSVLADDMGLGKTLQVITALLKYKEDGLLTKEKALVIAPTGLLANWQSEIERFAPSLQSIIYHGSNRKLEFDAYDVVISSYGVMRSDATMLKKEKWYVLIIDEAQNIKNNNTNQAKALKTIGAHNFIAMSGTPVENRLSELWSIMDYSNRGFFGTSKEFHEHYALPIEQFNDVATADKLKKVTAPFLMRRLKSDKTIIADLPDKIEMDCFAVLASQQASLYDTTLKKAMDAIEGIDTKDSKSLFVRQGLVLQMILALKQICNHPTQFLKNKIMDASISGKLELLFDKLDVIVESGEKVLIFTQFTEMGNLLKHFIAERYQLEPLFYHGGCSIKQRSEMVNDFQTNRADKIFILSLKAAGTGLNLTAANHVIHYDLWWNPAVEAQATDRAYRIGQKSNVMVHRFITKNTFEERINEMIQSKKALAEMTVSTGENWIGNLSNKELKSLFAIK